MTSWVWKTKSKPAKRRKQKDSLTAINNKTQRIKERVWKAAACHRKRKTKSRDLPAVIWRRVGGVPGGRSVLKFQSNGWWRRSVILSLLSACRWSSIRSGMHLYKEQLEQFLSENRVRYSYDKTVPSFKTLGLLWTKEDAFVLFLRKRYSYCLCTFLSRYVRTVKVQTVLKLLFLSVLRHPWRVKTDRGVSLLHLIIVSFFHYTPFQIAQKELNSLFQVSAIWTSLSLSVF